MDFREYVEIIRKVIVDLGWLINEEANVSKLDRLILHHASINAVSNLNNLASKLEERIKE